MNEEENGKPEDTDVGEVIGLSGLHSQAAIPIGGSPAPSSAGTSRIGAFECENVQINISQARNGFILGGYGYHNGQHVSFEAEVFTDLLPLFERIAQSFGWDVPETAALG